MSEIIIEHGPNNERLKSLGVDQWPTWTKEVSVFPWTFSTQEIAYILEGEVTVTTKTGATVTFAEGDLVTFPKGLSCTWSVKKALRKHYKLG